MSLTTLVIFSNKFRNLTGSFSKRFLNVKALITLVYKQVKHSIKLKETLLMKDNNIYTNFTKKAIVLYIFDPKILSRLAT